MEQLKSSIGRFARLSDEVGTVDFEGRRELGLGKVECCSTEANELKVTRQNGFMLTLVSVRVCQTSDGLQASFKGFGRVVQ